MLQRRVSPNQQEIALLSAVQRRIAVPQVVTAARGLSYFGEHALGWLVLGALGALVDRHRPADPAVAVLAGTPSQLSFPSSHAASTTAAAILYGGLLRRRLTPALVPPMLISRLVLGVHYPTDVLVGSALGALIGAGTRRRLRGGVPGTGQRGQR
jgi:membrane-associated phospholipid phosphatase